ncbi:MAG: DUF6515 family protein [Bacteroidota bacterium]
MKTRSTLFFFFLLFLLVSLTNISQAQRGRYNSYYPIRGQYFSSIPGVSFSLQFGGHPYYYSSGSFYRPYGNFFEIAAPPFGLHVNILPRGSRMLRINGYPYHYFNGVFYRPNARDFEVVPAPVGAEVSSIPSDSKTMVIDGEKYYEYNGTYFRGHVKPNGELWYIVEGKHGVLNTDRNSVADNNAEQQTDNRPAIGEVFDKLPSDYKTVVINSKKFFVSPGHVYYEEVLDGNQVRYKVAGK